MESSGHLQVGFSNLPQEIVDHIIDQLKTDRPRDKTLEVHWRQNLGALVACTLVCHNLLPRSSKHALGSIKVLCPPALCKSGGPHSDTELGRLLSHAESSPRLISNIYALCLAGRPNEELIGRAVRRFTNLTHLRFRTENSQLIDAIDLEDQAESVPSLLVGAHHVEQLVFERCYVRSILRFLSLFASVDKLMFDIVWCIARELPSDVFERLVCEKTQHLHADTITIGTSDTRILRLAGPMLAPRSLRTLCFMDLCGNACRFVEPFLQEEACLELECLRVQILSYAWRSTQRNEDEKKVLDLTCSERLREVEVTLRDSSYLTTAERASFSPDFFAFACSFILGNLPPSVQHVRLRFDPAIPDMTLPVYDLALRNLATFLAACSALERLEFVGRLGVKPQHAQSPSATKSYLTSKFFFQQPHIVHVIEDTF
ncbi:hypothetical protein PHLGIDRAFT_271196 [Phlebiopsis gigantea 11061_1 CR5-6]|uniref:Uncharacterized protein n=1 Tax=Phlebiopsis gigantea (strain 11061_1 CR5-6) TaxID=745531 RepID=A0A0C3NE89_PHLG1|nr:hypothetical protein PHLGIDRAFT_271196 [Phlebiopsis gigantea 11061_1 CR5-6]